MKVRSGIFSLSSILHDGLHVYAFLGHPFAQISDGDETIVKLDDLKHFDAIYLDLALRLLRQERGLRVLSTVEHDEHTIHQDSHPGCPVGM